MTFKKEESGLISNPSIHDGRLISISVDEPDSCRLRFVRSSLEIIEFNLKNVSFFKANDFMLGNIVGELFVYKGEKIPEERLKELLSYGREVDPSYFEKIRIECIEKELLFFEVEPSYGCRVQALCGAVDCLSISPS